MGSAIKTFVMFAGEYDFGTQRFSSSNKTTSDYLSTGSWERLITDVETLNTPISTDNFTTDNSTIYEKVTYNHKAEVILGQLIFAAFVFLFAVVVMNLLNAFAIGDIQVKMFSGLQRRSLLISSPCVKAIVF